MRSKHWLSLISDPKFCHSHTLRNPHSSISAFFSSASCEFCFIPLGLDHNPTSTSNFNPLKFVDNPNGNYIIQSCNGLFFCSIIRSLNYKFSDPATGDPIGYVLNPTTNQFRTLTPPPAAAATTGLPRVFGYGLAFDPSKSPHYKVIFIWFANEPAPFGYCRYHRIEIYSSETRSWRLLDSAFETQSQVCYEEGVYCNGAIHWVGIECEMTYYHIDEERVGLVDALPTSDPKKSWEWRMATYLWESQGRLQLIYVYKYSPAKFEVLEMGRDYSGWYVKYNVDLDPLCTACPYIQGRFYILLSLAPEQN